MILNSILPLSHQPCIQGFHGAFGAAPEAMASLVSAVLGGAPVSDFVILGQV